MTKHSEGDTHNLASIGIDIGKDVFHIVGFDLDGNVVLRRQSSGLRWWLSLRSFRPVLSVWKPASAPIL